MHVGLNLLFLEPGATGGMETYARELIPELVAQAPEHRFTAFVSREAAAEGPWLELDRCEVLPVRAADRWGRVRGEQQLLPGHARRAQIDLLHSLASTAPAWGQFRRVTTIHDLIYLHVPDAHAGLSSLGMRVLVPLAARRSHRIIADSAATRDDLRERLRVPSGRIDVIPLGVRVQAENTPLPETDLRARLKAGQRSIILSVSAKLAHKNLHRLIGALALIPAGRRPLLVLPGYPTEHERELHRHATALGVGEDVRFLGWVPTDELERLYAAASAVVLPSLIEGFGLPVLEAMTRGVPVACSRAGALAEISGDAALHFDPRSEPEIASAIERLLTDPQLAASLVAAGHEQIKQFTWGATAAGTLAAYERALVDEPA